MASPSIVSEAVLSPEVLEAASRGWHLHPLVVRKKVPCLKGWQWKASADLPALRRWAKEFPGCNWGLVTGSLSGVFVLDVDGVIGEASLRDLEQRGYRLPETFTVLTGRGIHVYYRMPPCGEIANSTGKIASGLDIRGDGGFVVIPPSRHPNGTLYRYANPYASIQEAPEWLLRSVVTTSPQSSKPLSEGFRNTELTRSAGRLRRRGFSREKIAASLHRENHRRCATPLPLDEVDRIAASIAKYPAKGPDVLDISWNAVQAKDHPSNYARFQALILELSVALKGDPVALPLERIAGHFGCHWTQIRRYRQRAVIEGLIREVECAIPHRRASRYVLCDR